MQSTLNVTYSNVDTNYYYSINALQCPALEVYSNMLRSLYLSYGKIGTKKVLGTLNLPYNNVVQ